VPYWRAFGNEPVEDVARIVAVDSLQNAEVPGDHKSAKLLKKQGNHPRVSTGDPMCPSGPGGGATTHFDAMRRYFLKTPLFGNNREKVFSILPNTVEVGLIPPGWRDAHCCYLNPM
jgi:hypothetical protein